jgi:WXG100 family type VII secretion target
MTAPKVRSDHEALKQIAQSFAARSESTAKATQNVKAKLGVLQGGDWVGKGATKFYNEMNSAVMPSLNRLSAALAQAAMVTGKISVLMREAEREAAGVFREQADERYKGEGLWGDTARGSGLVGGQSEAVWDVAPVEASSGAAGLGPATPGEDPLFDRLMEKIATVYNNGVIQQHIDSGNPQEAVNAAIRLYNLDVSRVSGGITFDPAYTKGDAVTGQDGSIRVGPKALRSAGWLASTIGHEIIHVNQTKDGYWHDGTQGIGMNEMEAYD